MSFSKVITALWKRLDLVNPSSEEKELFLFHHPNYAKYFTIYDQNGVIHSIDHEYFDTERVLSIKVPAGATRRIYINRQINGPQIQKWTYWTDSTALRDYLINRFGSWVIVEMVFFMGILFNSMLFFAFRSKMYLYYIGHLASVLIFTSVFWGFIDHQYSHYIALLSSISCVILNFLFARDFFETEELYPKIDSIFRGEILLWSLIIPLVFVDPQLLVRIITFLSILTVAISVLIIGYISYVKRYSHYFAVTISYIPIAVSVTAVQLSWKGMVSNVSDEVLYFGFAFQEFVMLIAIGLRVYNTEKNRIMALNKVKHGYRQLSKVFYPHQISAMEEGKHLEQSMPTGESRACVISFDIAGSSGIKAKGTRQFLRNIFSECGKIMMENYNKDTLQANAFRVKEMGDGFLCTVGFPFACPIHNEFESSVELAESFVAAFCQNLATFDYPEPIYCGVGIAYGNVEGFFPDSSPIEYDLFGHGIVLATRYEGMRKAILSKLNLKGNIIILQEQAWNSISRNKRDGFQRFCLDEHSINVRDDIGARCLYFKIVESYSPPNSLDLAA